MSVKVGCCGFPMAKAEYYRQFPVVEIQQTFYNLPRVQTAEKWRREALALHSRSGRGDFEFTLKAWQLITHEPSSPTYRRLRKPIPDAERSLCGSFRATEPVLKAWTETAAVARALGASVIVFQCPPRFTPTTDHVDNLRKFFESADGTEFVMAWEPRGDWPPDLVRGLCAELQLVHVVDPLKQVSQSEGLRYFRLHGVTGYRYLHTDQDLQTAAERCATDAPTYVLFNLFPLTTPGNAISIARSFGQADPSFGSRQSPATRPNWQLEPWHASQRNYPGASPASTFRRH